MDPNWIGRDRKSPETPAGLSSRGRSGPPPGRGSRRRVAALVTALALLVAIGSVATAGVIGSRNTSATPVPSASAVAATSSPTPPSTDVTTASPAPPSAAPPTSAPTPTPQPTTPPLPSLLAAIGDSYSQAYSVSPTYRYDHTQFSWVIGTAQGDGVLSLLERFRALGASPAVIDAATSGKKMSDAPRQADEVVAAARKLGSDKTAYVTFELGTNDLCASPDAMTDPADFEGQLQAAISTLRAGLPAGSRILMLAVPDFPHFQDITAADPAASTNLALPQNSSRCAPYLGTSSAPAVARADSYLAQYDASLKAACDDIDNHEGAAGQLYCTYDAALLADSDFTIGDLSTVDYFHPSLSGQAKMAEDAWRADVWGSRPPP